LGFADEVKEEGLQGGEVLAVSSFALFKMKGKVFFWRHETWSAAAW